uniref:Uncharacterized protein n=1 Tax=Sphaerodactylus townsendi TaxID=933632 RepID=A0ACB8F6U3_9SAUR
MQVIAIVMDSFTDMDIFYDLHDACRKRLVPVYILLDQAFLCHFMEMCKKLECSPEQEYLMRVRTITGNTYCARSGAKIIGSVHEKFMLIDGIKVTTGSYSVHERSLPVGSLDDISLGLWTTLAASPKADYYFRKQAKQGEWNSTTLSSWSKLKLLPHGFQCCLGGEMWHDRLLHA